MARIRTIKPELPHSETLGSVSRDARLLFINLFTIADDSGRARASSRLLASLLYPYDDDAPSLIDGWLSELSGIGAIRLYQCGDTKYLDIPKWLEHQKIDKPSSSRIPSFDECSASPREDSRIVGDGPRTVDQGPSTKDLVPNADKPPIGNDDLKTRLWGPALDWLAKQTQRSPSKLRPILGRWCKVYGDGMVLNAVVQAAKQSPLDPVPYIEKALRNAKQSRSTITEQGAAALEALADITGYDGMEGLRAGAEGGDTGPIIDMDGGITPSDTARH